MPYPAQISHETLIETAWKLVETQGFERLTLNELARSVGVKAPSLYNHIKNKAALLKAINELTEQRLFDALRPAINNGETDPISRMTALAHAYRVFALAYPIQYTLAFTTIDEESRPDLNRQVQDVLDIQAIMGEIAGEGHSLSALRGALALIHGFVMLEINDQLRRGGDLNEAFRLSVEAYLAGWQQR